MKAINCFKRNIFDKPVLKNPFRCKATSAAEYCMESVKRYDYENFICTLLLKEAARSCAFAVRGFNVEIAKVAEQVSDQNIGLMRLQFWDDVINSCFANDIAKIPKHPVAAELHKSISKTKLPKRYFKALITCRRNHLKNNSFNSLHDVETYSENSVSSVYYIILEGSNCRNVHADHAASHLGKAQGIVQQLRCIPITRRIKSFSIPQDILIKNKVSQEELLRGTPSERLDECTYEMACCAYQHLKKARSFLGEVPPKAKSVLLPAIPINNYLEKLEKVNYNVFHPSLQKRSWNWLIKLWVTNIQNKY